jgi:putative ABC transport system permease protein
MLTGAGSTVLREQAQELQGGDVVFESALPIDGEALLETVQVTPEQVSEEYAFTGTFEGEGGTAPFSVHAVDAAFPLYGTMVLTNSVYRPLAPNEVVIAPLGLERLGVEVGDTVVFGNASYIIVDTIESEPTVLFGGFEFFPHIFMSLEGYEAAGVDPSLLRMEYRYAALVPTLTEAEIERLRTLEDTESTIDVDIAGQDRRGLQFGLATVSDFLTIVVLITTVLATVNIYSSTLYLVTVERKSLAVLLALGLGKRGLTLMLGLALLFVVLIAGVTAAALASLLYDQLTAMTLAQFSLTLPPPPFLIDAALTLCLLIGVAITSFLPAIRQTLALSPRQILIGGGENNREGVTSTSLIVVSVVALIPLLLMATVLLRSVTEGVIAMTAIIMVYCVVALLFGVGLTFVYTHRHKVGFFLRTIITEKRSDGLFGIVAFTSLFVAIAALVTLVLLQSSLRQYLAGDLATTVPTTYVLDVQPSQKDVLTEAFPELTLFSNLGARLVSIDALVIEEELAKAEPAIDRELGREFNLTARTDLLASEQIVAGTWSRGSQGEISVDEEFAERAGISLGSRLVFSVQGFTVEGVVTSLRSTDSRSGLPFFYFVLSPLDIGQFPSVYFGYGDYDETSRQALGRFLAETMPNVSLIETAAVGEILLELLRLMLGLVFIVTLPPLVIATLLVVTLIVSGYSIRRRELARLRALGLTKRRAFVLYVFETVSLTVAATVLAYLSGIAATWSANYFVLELDQIVFFDPVLGLGIGVIVVAVTSLAWLLFKTDTMPLRELLAYE